MTECPLSIAQVEPDRWYYAADKLGVLVWQDMPSMFFQAGPQDLSPADKSGFESELMRMIEDHKSWTCIVTWVIFNEVRPKCWCFIAVVMLAAV